MFYTITITNNQSSQPVRVNNYEDISISPTLEYSIHDYISDNYTTQSGYISIPLYNDVRYINIPRNTIITLYTENSDEALYYDNLNIPNCEVSIDEKDTEKFTPQNTIVFKQTSGSNIGEVELKNYIGNSVKNYVKYVAVPEGVTTITDGAFQNSSFEYAYIPNTVTTMSTASFMGCSNLTTFIMPDNVTNLGSGAFANCTNLRTIKLSNNLTTLENGTFAECSSLESIEIPNSIVEIKLLSFSYCTSLKTITIPNSVEIIAQDTFLGCTGLETIIINKPEGSISSASWSAPETTQIIWNG